MDTFKKYLYWGTLGLFAYMPFHIFISQWFSTYTGGLDGWKIAKDVFTAFLTSVIVLAVLITRKYTRLYLGFVVLAILYLGLHLILFVGTHQPQDTGLLATVYNNRLIWYVLIGYGLALLAPRLADPRRFSKVLIACAAAVCLIGLAQWILPKDIMTRFGYSIERGVKPNFFIDDKPDFPRVFSTIRDPNSLGAFLILPSVLVFLELVRNWRNSRRTMYLGFEILFLLITILTFSRSALIAVVLAHTVAVVFVLRRQLTVLARRHVAAILVIALVLISGVILLRNHYIVQNVLLHSDQSTKQADPNELRVQFLEKGVKGVEKEPEGHGPGTAGLVSTKLNGKGLLTENYYLQLAYEVGLAGLILFLIFLGLILKILWILRRDAVAQALIASFIGLAFMNFVLHTWANEAVAASWFILAGVNLKEARE